MDPLNADWIRSRLQESYDADALSGDHIIAGISGIAAAERQAAVLLPLIAHQHELTVLFTQRSAHLAYHPGQISFPGGSSEAQDNSLIDTALRETEEEIGLAPEQIDILGQLTRYQTITGFMVTPIVGLIQPPLQLQLDSFEVEQVFEVPLSFFLDRRNHQRHSRIYRGQRRYYYALPYKNHYIWGATAAMLISFVQILSNDQK